MSKFYPLGTKNKTEIFLHERKLNFFNYIRTKTYLTLVNKDFGKCSNSELLQDKKSMIIQRRSTKLKVTMDNILRCNDNLCGRCLKYEKGDSRRMP
jgi:hypothetical protein